MYKTIIDFPNYEVNELGIVKNKVSGKLINIRLAKNGYFTCNLWKNNKYKTIYIHRLIGIYFIKNPKNLRQINHINGVKTDNRLINLEWSNQKQNVNHSILTGLTPLGMKRKHTKLTDEQIIEIRNDNSLTHKELALKYNCSQTHITNIKNFKDRKYVVDKA